MAIKKQTRSGFVSTLTMTQRDSPKAIPAPGTDKKSLPALAGRLFVFKNTLKLVLN